MLTLVTIVEGYGEAEAVSTLLRLLRGHWKIARPWRQQRNRVVHEGVLEAVATKALSKLQPGDRPAALLVILDADDDCPAALGPALSKRLRISHSHIPSAVVVAKRTFEAWLLTGWPEVSDPESLANPKGRLRRLTGEYGPRSEQARLTSQLDWQHASTRSPSFAKLLRALDALERECS